MSSSSRRERGEGAREGKEKIELTFRLKDRINSIFSQDKVSSRLSTSLSLSRDLASLLLEHLVLVELVVLSFLLSTVRLASPVPVGRRRSRVDLPGLLGLGGRRLREVSGTRLERYDVGVLEKKGKD